MARKDILRYEVATAQSMATTFTSSPTNIKYLDNIAYQINITTSNSTGTFSVQGSADYDQNQPGTAINNAGNWVDLPLGGPTTAPVAAGANDSILIYMNQLPFSAIRVVYTSTVAGTGHCDIFLMARQVGG